MNSSIIISPVIFATFLALNTAHASITLSGNFQTGTPTPTLTITEDFALPITVSGTVNILVFDEWTTSDGARNNALDAPDGQVLSYQIDGGSVMTVPIISVVDNEATISGSITNNDGSIIFGDINVMAGQILTIKSQSFTFVGTSGFNTAISSNFTGTVFATDSSSERATSNATVPEISSFILGALTLPMLIFRRRRQQCVDLAQ